MLLGDGAVAFGEPVEDAGNQGGRDRGGRPVRVRKMLWNDGIIKETRIPGTESASSGTGGGRRDRRRTEVDFQARSANVRAAGKNVVLSGKVGKNVNAFGETVRLRKGSTVGGSLVSGARTVIAGGGVRGDVRLFAESVTLDGEFFGDVTINSGFENLKDENDRHPVKTKLTVLPGTVVHGTLTFTGSAADVSKDARIGKFDWKKTPESVSAFRAGETVWDVVRTVFMTVAFMLLGLLLFRAFPSAFARIDDFAFQKPWNASAWGLAVIFSPVAAIGSSYCSGPDNAGSSRRFRPRACTRFVLLSRFLGTFVAHRGNRSMTRLITLAALAALCFVDCRAIPAAGHAQRNAYHTLLRGYRHGASRAIVRGQARAG